MTAPSLPLTPPLLLSMQMLVLKDLRIEEIMPAMKKTTAREIMGEVMNGPAAEEWTMTAIRAAALIITEGAAAAMMITVGGTVAGTPPAMMASVAQSIVEAMQGTIGDMNQGTGARIIAEQTMVQVTGTGAIIVSIATLAPGMSVRAPLVNALMIVVKTTQPANRLKMTVFANPVVAQADGTNRK